MVALDQMLRPAISLRSQPHREQAAARQDEDRGQGFGRVRP